MNLFEPSKTSYPKSWVDMSFEFRLMFVYHGSMMLLMVLGGAISAGLEAAIAAALLAVFAVLSARRRQAMGWRWGGAGLKGVLGAVLAVALVAFFLFAVTPLFPPFNAQALPWYLAGVGIGLFNVLQSLKFVHLAEADYVADCRAASQPEVVARASTEAAEPQWKTTVLWLFRAAFLGVWLVGVSSFYFFGVGMRSGSPTSTATQSEQLVDHGRVVFVTKEEKAMIDNLQAGMMIGIPSLLVLGLICQFGLGVKVFARPGKEKG